VVWFWEFFFGNTSSKTVATIKELQKNMSIIILGFEKRFDRLVIASNEQSLHKSQLSQRQDATDVNQACNLSRMNVIDESLEELEKKWMAWESGDPRLTPCYRDMEEKSKHMRF
jgi:hypothetical protein